MVTRSADIDPNSVLFTDDIVPPIILTSTAEVPIGNTVEERLRRVLCEGGPHLFTSLLVADRIDDLCLTLSPTLVVGPAERICAGSSPFEAPREMHLASVLSSHGSLLLRYTRR